MGYYQQSKRRISGIGEDGNSLMMLIVVLLTIFIIFTLIKVVYYFSFGPEGLTLYNNQVLDWVSLPAHIPTLLTRPWTLLTHFFMHDGVWHLITNLLWLWGFGHILQDLLNNRTVVPIFLYGAFAGAVAYIIFYNLIPTLNANIESSSAIGASAGVMAIAIATTVLAPNFRIFPLINGGIPLWVVTLIFVIIDLATIPYNNPGGHIAHLAGAGMGFLFMVMFKKGSDWSGWINAFFDWVNNLFNPDKPKRGRTMKSQVFYKTGTVVPFKVTKSNVTQQRVDEILDKIHQKGYNALTVEEKEILKRAGEEK
jgi:membrane associated rhomboid family serine protease